MRMAVSSVVPQAWAKPVNRPCTADYARRESPARAARYMADGVQGNVTEYNAMDVMFGTELPHMGLMAHATSAFVDSGLDYTLGYSQVQLVMGQRMSTLLHVHQARCFIYLAELSDYVRCV